MTSTTAPTIVADEEDTTEATLSFAGATDAAPTGWTYRYAKPSARSQRFTAAPAPYRGRLPEEVVARYRAVVARAERGELPVDDPDLLRRRLSELDG